MFTEREVQTKIEQDIRDIEQYYCNGELTLDESKELIDDMLQVENVQKLLGEESAKIQAEKIIKLIKSLSWLIPI